jgi:ribose 5-phosphate isomerase A
MDEARKLKIAAAAEALTHVKDGMRLGIGTGSTAEEFVRLLADKVQGGFRNWAFRLPRWKKPRISI